MLSEEGESEKMNHPSLTIFLAALIAAPSFSHAQTNVTSDAVGFVTLNIRPGTGTSRGTTYLSLPLLENVPSNFTGQSVGTLTGVTSNSLSNTNAGWAPGALSQPASPYAVQITSGNGVGRIFLIASSANTGGASAGSSNTASTVFLSPIESTSGNIPTAVGSAVQAGDKYRILPLDTLLTAFGTPSPTGIRGGTSSTNSDNITLIVNGTASTYYYNTSLNRWARVFLNNPAEDNVALPPYYGILFSRLATNASSFQVAGTVPSTARKTQIKNSGLTTLAQYLPTDTMLAGLGLHNLSNWVKSSTSTNADIVILVVNGTSTTYWHNGTNWRNVGVGTINRDTTTVPVGAAIYINKRGTASGYTTLTQGVPYNLGL